MAAVHDTADDTGRSQTVKAQLRLRELIVGSYRLIYKVVADNEIHVIAFVNGARDLDMFLKSRGRE